ncbi:MAG: DUF4173 domain-containing protein [Clostridia bacterium]|nr:DUF4173 domain-containing protein [Clostridia bacterium]
MNEPASDKITAGVRPAEWYEKDTPAPVREVRVFTRHEKTAAWLMIPLGYCFFRACPVYRYPLGAMLTVFALFALTFFLLHKNGRTIRGMALAAAVSALPVSLALFFSANAMIHTVAGLYCLLACAYTVYAACGNTLEEGLSDLLPMDLLTAVFALPFACFGTLFSAIGAGNVMKKSGKVLLRIYGGLMLALIPTVLVVSLLSYDSSFRRSMNDLFSLDLGDLFSHLVSLVFGVLLALYFFGLYAAASENRFRDKLNAEKCRNAADRMHSFSPVTSCSAVVPVLGVYGVFFFSQLEQYVSAFAGDLPEGAVYSGYAREGFFELCAVSFINFILLAVTGMFTKRTEKRRAHPAVRIVHGLLSGCTLVLIATAMSKMMLYIETYGLTPKRVYAAWFMLVLAAVFALVIVKQFVPRLKLIALSAVVCVGMFALLGLSNVDGIIAEYNVDRYLDGTLETLDDNTLQDLGDAAVPARIRAGVYYPACAETTQEHGVFSVTLPKLRAELARNQTPEAFD